MVSNPYWHYAFFSKHCTPRAGQRSLVLATADSSFPMLLHSLGIESIDIVDACASPLKLCSMTSNRLGATWKTFMDDALKLTAPGLQPGYGIVVNDAFLTRFADEEKVSVLESVKGKLNEGGIYISTARIADQSAPSGDHNGYQSDSSRKAWFVERAVARFVEVGGVAGFSLEEVEKIANLYMRSMVSFRFGSVDHLTEVIEASGMRLIDSEVVTTIGESEESSYVRFACAPG